MNAYLSQRHTPSSPSITMEKGAYNVFNNQGSPSKFRRGYFQGKGAQLSMRDKRLAGIIILLTLAVAFCFSSAYYLFNTGWVKHATRHNKASSNNALLQPFQVVEFERELGNAPIDSSTKYLSYLPHSGFHNQRIALENALLMAYILNRTLLVPPVRLGKGILTYYPFDHLYELVALSGKDGLGHCTNASAWKALPIECADYYDYTQVPWNWLSNVSEITKNQPIIQRWNMTGAWLSDYLGIIPNETFEIKDNTPYQFRFVDADPFDMPSSRFDEVISMSLLEQLPHRLIQVGTLFGSSRVRLRRALNIAYRTVVRESMTFNNDMLLGLAESVKAKLGGEYVAIHIRLGDGGFERKAKKNVRLVWWRLVQEVLGVEEKLALDVERQVAYSSFSSPPNITVDQAKLRASHPLLPPFPSTILPKFPCRRPWHDNPRLAAFNVPLFISTDVSDPESHPLLQRFFATFPCTFILSDFVDEITALGRLKSGYDGLMLKDFILPFLDAVVAGKAYQVVGTDGSTFSQFVQDVLWRRYRGWEIVQRG